jgi:steroid delta-isomerase-like uncharacterized protein
MMSADANVATLRSLYAHFNADQFDAAIALFADDAEIVSIANGVTLRGPEGMRQFMQLYRTAVPDGKVTILSHLANDEGATTECIYEGRNNGPLKGPKEDIPPSGNPVSVRFTEVYRFRDGKIVSMHNYVDSVTILSQIGAISL